MRIIVAPDSFKGTMTSLEAGDIIADAFRTALPDSEIIRLAIADGGEGSLDAFLSNCGGEKIGLGTLNPNFGRINASYAILDGKTAIIELAECSGLNLASPKNPLITTTFGMGAFIADALDRDIKDFILCLGGSATNDCGAGLLAALGVKFYDKDGKFFIPTGGTLKDVLEISTEFMDSRLFDARFRVMCDVSNPLYGENGAAYVYAKQKGADDAAIKILDDGLKHFSNIIKTRLNLDVSSVRGGGAAGGAGAGVKAFLNAELISGIELILDACNFDKLLDGASLVVTGEGSFDRQSLMGKVVFGISKRAKAKNVPVAVIAGRADKLSAEELNSYGITEVIAASKDGESFDEIKKTCRKRLKKAVGLYLADGCAFNCPPCA